jgi:hypothetical protein
MKNSSFSLWVVTLTAATWLFGFASGTQAASLWNEATDGDLSDQGLSPTALGALSPGSNVLKATFNAGTTNPSPDYFTFEIPEGSVLVGIELLSWASSPTFEDIAFMAVQEGPAFDFTVPADRSNANGLFGWTHLRSTQVGSNKILFEMSVSNRAPAESGVDAFYAQEATTYPPDLLAQFPDLPDRLRALETQWAPGAQGFNLPLKAGTYSFWLRQGSNTNITTEFDFKTAPVSTPEPASGLALGIVFGTGLLMAKKQQNSLL